MRLFFVSLLVFVDGGEEVGVPGLAEAADEGFFEVFVERDATCVAAFHGTAADVPLMVVDGCELAEDVHADGVEVAGDGLLPVYLSVSKGLFYGTVCSAVLAPGHVGAFAVVDEGGAGLGGVVEGRDAFSVHHVESFGGHVWFHLGEYFLKDGDLLFEERGAAVALDAAGSFALGEVAGEAFIDEVFSNDTVLNDEHFF